MAIKFESSAPGKQVEKKEKSMKKSTNKKVNSEAEYDFRSGVRGKYAKRYAQGTNLVPLEPDVAKIFTSAQSVNESLRALAGIIRLREKELIAG